MVGMLGDAIEVDARVQRRTSNSLQLAFRSGPGDPIAIATQGAGDSKFGKLGTLLGFRNGGPGRHALDAGERRIWVATADGAPTVVTEAATGDELGRLERSDDGSSVVGPDGSTLVRITADPDEPKSLDAFRLVLADGSDAALGWMMVARTQAAWSLWRDVEQEILWWGRAKPLQLPLLGAAIQLDHTVDATTGDLLLAVCVDICIGLRPYAASMK